MTAILFTHHTCLLHDNGPAHPESPARLKAVLCELDKPIYQNLQRHEAPRATHDQIMRVHPQNYIQDILVRIPQTGRVALDHETSLVPESGEAALRAAGAVIAAIDVVMNDEGVRAFCAVRPPGHHAAVPPASGFCLFNNIAIGAMHALDEHKLKRIAIVDFDVHHGNGTQAFAEEHAEILFISSHQMPLWPGSGQAGERGPLGNIINIPLAPGTDGTGFRTTMQTQALPAVAEFRPELIMISAGFDAHRDDPLAGLNLMPDDFGWITGELVAIADTYCQGRLVSTLEGGYDLEALALSTGAHVKALLVDRGWA